MRSNLAVAKRARGREQKGVPRIALFNWCRRSLFYRWRRHGYLYSRERLKGDNRNRQPNAAGERVVDCRCMYVVWSALLAPSTVSTSPNRRFCRRTHHFSSVPLHTLTDPTTLFDTSRFPSLIPCNRHSAFSLFILSTILIPIPHFSPRYLLFLARVPISLSLSFSIVNHASHILFSG